MAAIQKKSQKETFIDCCFVVFSQGYLVEQVRQWLKHKGEVKGYDGKNPPALLDIGCYNGRLNAFMKQLFVFTDYTGIDYQQKYLDMAFMKESSKFKLKQCDITQGLPFPDNSFEIVVSSEVLEHIEGDNYPFILREINRVLKDDGRAILGFPMNTEEKEFHSVEKELKRLGHVNFPVHNQFIERAKRANLELVKFDSSYTTSSSWRIKKDMKTKEYQKIKNALGSNVARAVMMILEDDHTGGGFYTFDKVGPLLEDIDFIEDEIKAIGEVKSELEDAEPESDIQDVD